MEPISQTWPGEVAHALVRAVSRLVSIPRPRAGSLSRPGVGISADAARRSACATSTPPDAYETYRLKLLRAGFLLPCTWACLFGGGPGHRANVTLPVSEGADRLF